MDRAPFDIVVVGAGHNSLIAAAYLARAEQKVLVLETHAYAGGGAVSRELTLPGFVHDTHATGITLLQVSPVLSHDELDLISKYGLELINPPTNEMTIFSDGETLVWYRDLDMTCGEIAKYSPKDAESYRKTIRFAQSVLPIVAMSMMRPPVSFGGFISLVEKAPFGNELISVMMRSTYDIIVERFEHPRVRIALLKRSMVSACGPEENGTGLNILFMMAAVHGLPLGIVAGGTQNLTRATVQCIEAHGGEVRVNTCVKRIVNSKGRVCSVELEDGSIITASKAVLAAIHPHFLGDMVSGLDLALLQRAKSTKSSFYATFMLHAALKERLQWKAGGEISYQCGVVNLVESTNFDEFRRDCDAPRWGTLSEHFATGVLSNSNHDTTRAPAGQHVLGSYTFVPFNLEHGGYGRWDEIKTQYAEWVIEKMSHFATNLDGNILAHAAESPLDMQRYSASFTAGDVMGIGGYLSQSMGLRPTAELSQYRVPGAEGLYLTGPYMHPGGGITGGGRSVAIRMMEDLKINYSKVMRV